MSGRRDNTATDTPNKVSVVITVLNESAGMVELVDALLGQTRLPDEIIVVDGGSTDGTPSALESMDTGEVPLRIVRRTGANIAEGRNHGIGLANHDVIACTDAGSMPDSNWLEELTKPFEDPNVAVVGGSYRVTACSCLERVVGLLTMPGQLTPIDPVRFNPSARSIAFRLSAWKRAGGFPEWLHTAEDTLFDCKLRKNGEVFVYADSAIVRWRPRSTLRSIWKQFRNYARGEARIGRGDGDTSYWLGRYAVVGFVLVVSLVCSAWLGSATVIVAGLFGVALLLTIPFHRRARAVARHTYRLLDYPVAIILGHWIAWASGCGQFIGRRDRQRRPDMFVERLRGYWGSEAVGDVPKWRMQNPDPPRTLIVSWHWPPTHRASAGVLANLFQAASSEMFQVLTRGMPTSDSDDPTRPPSLQTHFVSWPRRDDEEVRCWTWLASVRTAIRMVFRARGIHNEWQVQRVLAVYPHRFGFLAGWLTARMLGVPFVAYMHDLFAETLITNSRIKRAFWQRIDRIALESAELILVPTGEFADHYCRRDVRNNWVLPHCRPKDVMPSDPPPIECGQLRLLYAGNIYQAHEDAVVALTKAIEDLSDVDMTFLARRNRILPANSTQWLSRPQAIAEMHKSHVLIVALGIDTPYPEEVHCCFPSKITDYLTVGRPILAIVPPGCFVDRFVRETGCGVSVVTHSRQDIVCAIDVFRNPDTYRQMSTIARRLSTQLAATRWVRLLSKRLSYGAPADPATPGFPICEDNVSPACAESETMLVEAPAT